MKCHRKTPQVQDLQDLLHMEGTWLCWEQPAWSNSAAACLGGSITGQTTHSVVEVKALSRNQKLCRHVDPSQARFGPKIFQAFSNKNEATDEECQHIFCTRGPSCGSCSPLGVLTKHWPIEHLLSAPNEPQRREGGCWHSQG